VAVRADDLVQDQLASLRAQAVAGLQVEPPHDALHEKAL